MKKLLFLFVIISTFTYGFSATCKNPKITSNSFTTLDATIVTNIAFISEFTVDCESGKLDNIYAELGGQIVPVPIVGVNKFQISWTEDNKLAKSGDRLIHLFNEDGYSVYRKFLRAGEDVSTITPLFTVSISHPGAYNGPWLKSELFATIVSLFVSYFALSFKAKVTS